MPLKDAIKIPPKPKADIPSDELTELVVGIPLELAVDQLRLVSKETSEIPRGSMWRMVADESKEARGIVVELHNWYASLIRARCRYS